MTIIYLIEGSDFFPEQYDWGGGGRQLGCCTSGYLEEMIRAFCVRKGKYLINMTWWRNELSDLSILSEIWKLYGWLCLCMCVCVGE